ncbi:uncharacterized protein PV09_07944 [Verruconis gallopava]|uniref:Uncharacterized protein n=1 Tax=Verruconis gallopava TaxID=253628 RepID=A0A0D1XEI3_9PEZI|nr:uncharacterized protein PV09_07944 [Verruconis gallopava]KIW00591.1 hypothetical protein PV09_07944 [Verruconis gallopava]
MANIVTSREITTLLLGNNPRRLQIDCDDGVDVDAAAWIAGKMILISIVHLELEDALSSISIKLPRAVAADTSKLVWPQYNPDLNMQDSGMEKFLFRFQSLDDAQLRDGQRSCCGG